MKKVKLGTLYIDGVSVESDWPHRYSGQKCTIGDTVEGKEIKWIEHDGMLIADRPLMNRISYYDILQFSKQCSINGINYVLCCPSKQEMESAFDSIGDSEEIWCFNGFYSWTCSNYKDNSDSKWMFGYSGAHDWGYNNSNHDNHFGGWRPVLRQLNTDGEIVLETEESTIVIEGKIKSIVYK